MVGFATQHLSLTADFKMLKGQYIEDTRDEMIADMCMKKLAHYLNHIYKTWFIILDCKEDLLSCLDVNTVQLLQIKYSFLFSEDHRAVLKDMQNGVLFLTITDSTTQNTIWCHLNMIPHMISSIYTFLKNIKYLKPCAKVMKCLLSVKFKGSICQAFRQQHTGQTQCQIQVTEYSYFSLSFNLNDCIWKAYIQIWLFKMWHFSEMIEISPHKNDEKLKSVVQQSDDNLWHRIAQLALNNDFDSAAIQQYVRWDPDVKMAFEFLC